MLYKHKDINPNCNTNTNTYTNTGELFRFGYERVYQFLASVHADTRRETQFLKAYANYTMLAPIQRAAHLGMFKISIHLCQSRSEKTQPHASTVENSPARLNGRILTSVFSKSSNSQDHFFWVWRHQQPSPISCLRVIMTNGDCHILSARAYDCTKWLWTWTTKPSSSKPYQT